MQIHFICIGQKMPKWIQDGYQEYAKRLPKSCELKLVELPVAKRNKTSNLDKLKQQETEKILASLPKHATLIALDEHGENLSTTGLASKLTDWLAAGKDLALIVGGPDGLSQEILQQASWKWSLSKLTLPHPLVRVVVAEQIYRAWTLTQNHPYHRE